jgi:aspartate/methionine/tyrosine aminotransferase
MPSTWEGRFPFNEIITLLDVNRQHNLAESTSANLQLGELLDLVDMERLRTLPLGYGSAQGASALRDAVAEICGVAPQIVLTTQGTALALFLLAFEFCGRGSEAILTTPCFPPARDTLATCGVRIREARLHFHDGFRIDAARIADMLSPATRLVSIASPQNPSGVRVSRATVCDLLNAMTERAPEALLFVDETYREATYDDGDPPPSFASLDPRIITGASVSKAHGAPGLRVGWLTVPDPALRQRLMVAKMNLTVSGSPLDETLAAGLLVKRERVLAPRRRMLRQALAEVRQWLMVEQKHLQWVEPEGGALCCVRLRDDVFDDAAVSRFWAGLKERDLQLASGEWFGDTQRVFRLGFGFLPIERLAPALQALSSHLDAVLSTVR